MSGSKKKLNPKRIGLGCLVTIIFFGCLVFIIGSLGSDNNDYLALDKPWKELRTEEKRNWLNVFFQHEGESGLAARRGVIKLVKSQLKYPEEARFNNLVTWDNAIITDADSGFVTISGTGITKNGFGVEVGFSYQVNMQILPEKVTYRSVNVR